MSASVPALLSDHTVPEPRGPTVRPQAQNSIAHAQPAAHLADEEPGGRGGDDAGEEPESPGDAHEEAGVPVERMARARRKPPAHRQRSGRPFLGRRDGFPATQLGVGRVSLAPRHLGPHRPVPALTPPAAETRTRTRTREPRCPLGAQVPAWRCVEWTGQPAPDRTPGFRSGSALVWRQARHLTFCVPQEGLPRGAVRAGCGGT